MTRATARRSSGRARKPVCPGGRRGDWNGRGQITVSDKARLFGKDCLLRKIQLITNVDGRMEFTATRPETEVLLRQDGGPILFLPASAPAGLQQ